jgi:CorA-like Mg2+ transporter protein
MIIPPTWVLPDAIRVRLGQSTYGRQRAIVEEGHLLLVLHKPPGPHDRGREGVLFWRNPKGEWQSNRGGPGAGGLKRQVQSYVDIEGKLTEGYDNATSNSVLFELQDALTPLVRAAHNMYNALQEARESIKDDPALIEVRDLASEVERNLDLLLEDVRNAIQKAVTREAEVQARVSQEALAASHRLNILAALFLPLTATTSLFGMSFAHGMEEQVPLLFWIVLAGGVAFGVVMMTWVIAKPKTKVSSK